MAAEPQFVSLGKETDSIDVQLSYKIVALFSEGLYASPNKAVEELVTNSFDAGATNVSVILSDNLSSQDASIVVIDDGSGMDPDGLKQHWVIGNSNKRSIETLPKGRQQIGKFGIGKLATYVLSDRLTHITKSDGKYFSTSMDYTKISKRADREIEPKAPIKIKVRELTVIQAKEALALWLNDSKLTKSKPILFGKGAADAWTVAIMSSLKPKALEIRPGYLNWVLRTALPLRPDFSIYLNGNQLKSSKQEKGLIKKWVFGKDLTVLPRPAPKVIETLAPSKKSGVQQEFKFGLNVPDLGHIHGYAEAYTDLLTGKSDQIGRSYGFFVYVLGRLINVSDGHFQISPDELRHGTFGRMRVVVHIDSLDAILRSNREALSEGPLLTLTQNVLRGIFNAVRATIEKRDEEEEPAARLARRVAGSPSSLARTPIVDLAGQVASGKQRSKYLIVPRHSSKAEQGEFLSELSARAKSEKFITQLSIDYTGNQNDGIAQFDTANGHLRINAWHPFVATFYDEFANKKSGQPLELLAMAEVIAEAHMHAIGLPKGKIDELLTLRDLLLRNFANESGRRSAFSVAALLREARNDPNGLEERLCEAFGSLGYAVTPIGGRGKPDGVAKASLAADENGNPRAYAVSLEAKSKKEDKKKVAAKTVGISAIARQRDNFKCDHAVVVGPDFPTPKGGVSALGEEIDSEIESSKAKGENKTITLIRIDDLAKLVQFRPLKQLGLLELRELFETCRLPDESHDWIENICAKEVKKPPYKRIVETIAQLQKDFRSEQVRYAALRVQLTNLRPPIKYESDADLRDICKGMTQMAPGAIQATEEWVELDQSPDNVIAEIEAAVKETHEFAI